MIYLFSLIICALPILFFFISKVEKQNNFLKTWEPHSMLLMFLSILVIIFSPFQITKILDYTVMQVCVYILIISLLLFCIFYILKNKKSIKFEKKHMIVASFFCISLFVVFVFSLFLETSNVDVEYYVSLSKNFKNNNFNAEDFQSPIITVARHYLFTTMYYVNSVLFPNELYGSYFIINNMLFGLILISLINCTLNLFLNSKLWLTILMMAVSVIFVISLTFFSTAGNSTTMSLILIIALVNIIGKKSMSIESLISLIGFWYFSSTALLLILPLSLAIVGYNIFKNKRLIDVSLIFISILFLFLSLIVFTNIISEFYIFLFYALAIIYSIILYFTRKSKAFTKVYNFAVLNKKIVIYSSKIIYICLYILLVVLSFLTIYDVIYVRHYYHTMFAFVYISLSVGAILMHIITFIFDYLQEKKKILKNENNNDYIYFIFLINLIVVCEIIFTRQLEVIDSESSWRLIYLLVGMGGVINITLIIVLIVHSLIQFLLILMQNKLHHKWALLSKNARTACLPQFNSIISIIESFSIFGIWFLSAFWTSQPAPTLSRFNSSISENITGLAENDFNFMQSLNLSGSDKSYIADFNDFLFLSKLTNVNYYIGNSININLSSWLWSSNGFKVGIERWNKMVKSDDPRYINFDVSELIKLTIVNPIKTPPISLSGKEIKWIDYIFLDKNTDYFSKLNMTIDDSKLFSILDQNTNISVYKRIN